MSVDREEQAASGLSARHDETLWCLNPEVSGEANTVWGSDTMMTLSFTECYLTIELGIA